MHGEDEDEPPDAASPARPRPHPHPRAQERGREFREAFIGKLQVLRAVKTKASTSGGQVALDAALLAVAVGSAAQTGMQRVEPSTAFGSFLAIFGAASRQHRPGPALFPEALGRLAYWLFLLRRGPLLGPILQHTDDIWALRQRLLSASNPVADVESCCDTFHFMLSTSASTEYNIGSLAHSRSMTIVCSRCISGRFDGLDCSSVILCSSQFQRLQRGEFVVSYVAHTREKIKSGRLSALERHVVSHVQVCCEDTSMQSDKVLLLDHLSCLIIWSGDFTNIFYILRTSLL